MVEKFFQPAWVDPAAKKNAWDERSVGGFSLPATEWESKGRESHAWVGSEGFASSNKRK
jgi:hypothetical protein